MTTMDCEELRISRNRAYVEYLNETDITQKRLKQGVWKHLCLMADDAYRQEVKGEILHDDSRIGMAKETVALNIV